MSTTKRLADAAMAALIRKTPATPINNPPVWDTQPSPSFVFGVASNYSLVDLTSDPDGGTPNVTLNTGAVSLPSGVTYNTTLDRLEYDGIGALASTTGHVATADDGTDTTVSSAFAINILSDTWPAYGAHVQGGINVAGHATNMETEPYRTWNSKKDSIYAQHRYPTTSQVSAEIASTAWMRSQNANIRLIYYSFQQIMDSAGDKTSAKEIGYEAAVANGKLDDWWLYDKDGGGKLEYSNEAVGGAANPYYNAPGMPTGSSDDNYSIAYWSRLNSKYSSAFPWDGIFFDSLDFQDVFPRYKLVSDGTTNGDPDYLEPFSSGDSNPKRFRNGMLYDRDEARTQLGSDLAIGGNGGRDGTGVNKIASENEWNSQWDFKLCENVHGKLRLETTSLDGDFYLTGNNPDANVTTMAKAALITESMVNQTASNKLGKGFVHMDFHMNWNPSPKRDLVLGDITQDHYEAARLIMGIAMLHDGWMGCPNMSRGEWAFPYMDEMVYDPGDPVGGTPSFATISEPWVNEEPTIRAADQAATAGIYGVYWQEFDNVLWIVNFNEPTGNANWPQATEDTITLPDPDVGGGEVWRFAESDYSNGSRTEGGTLGEDQSPLINDGSLTGATIDMKRWTARMLVRSAS